MAKNSTTYEDEIDLINAFKTLWDGKFIIIFFILIMNLFGYIYVKIKDPVYESTFIIEIENLPPFYDSSNNREVGISKTFFDFTNNFYSKLNFENWKNNSKKSTLIFDNISKTTVINGYELSTENNLLAEIRQKSEKTNAIDFVIKTNNLSILNDFYDYSIYTNNLLQEKYVSRSEQELIDIKTKYKEFNTSDIMASRLLDNDEFITNIYMGQNVFNVIPPSLPSKISVKTFIVLSIMSVLGIIIGVLFVFIKKLFSN